jgi:hypothetical protein
VVDFLIRLGILVLVFGLISIEIVWERRRTNVGRDVCCDELRAGLEAVATDLTGRGGLFR